MDIYVGGTGALAERAREAVADQVRRIVPDHLDLGLASSSFRAWGDGTGEVRHVVADDVEVLFDGYLHRHGQPDLDAAVLRLARRVVDGADPLDGSASGVFNVVVREVASGRTHVANDPSGLFPVHVVHRGAELVVGSHLYLTGKAVGAGPDPLGIAAKIVLSFPLGTTTLFDGVIRPAPGEVLVHDPATGRLTSRMTETYFGGWEAPSGDAADAVWERLLDACRPVAESGATAGLMLSEGFDSRLIGGVLHHLGVPLRTFTHGTTGTLGTKIAAQVADRLDAEHRFHPLDAGFPDDTDALRRQLTLADNLHVPYWIHGAEHLAAGGARPLTTGYALDTTLGGHAYNLTASPAATARATFSTLARQATGRLTDADLESVAGRRVAQLLKVDLAAAEGRVRRFLDGDAAEQVAKAVPELPGAIHAELTRLRTTGSPSWSVALQRYFLENRVRRFSFGQELTLRSQAPVIVPSFEPALMRTLGRVPPRLRVQHQLYLQVVRRHLRPLARVRSGAHALPPVLPRGVLEGTRLGWKVYENRLVRDLMAEPGSRSLRAHRGVLYTEHNARQSPRFAIEDLIERSDIPVNRASMRRSVDKIRRHEIRVFLPVLYFGLEMTNIWGDL